MESIRLGIWGAGNIAGVMANTVCRLRESGDNTVALYAVAARDLGRAEAFAAAHGYRRRSAAMKRCSATRRLTLFTLQRRTHTITATSGCAPHMANTFGVRKAFTVNARQADDAIRYARSKGVLVTEAIWTRYQPMRRMIDETPAIRRDRHAAAADRKPRLPGCPQAPYSPEPALAGGALLDIGVYTLNFAEMVFGCPDSLHALCTKNEAGVDLTDSIALQWRDGAVANLTATAVGVSDRLGIVYGDKGYLVVENINNPQEVRVYDTAHELVQRYACPPQLTGYEYELLETVACIRQGKLECRLCPPGDDPHDGADGCTARPDGRLLPL